jgi:uncharacterized protein
LICGSNDSFFCFAMPVLSNSISSEGAEMASYSCFTSAIVANALGLLVNVTYYSLVFAQSGPAFNCAGKLNASESAICRSSELSFLDQQLSSAYAALLRESVGLSLRSGFQSEQKEWLRQRNSCGSDETCIAAKYNTRIEQLRGVAQVSPGASPRRIVCVRPIFEQEMQLRTKIDGTPKRTQDVAEAIVYLRNEFCRSTTELMTPDQVVPIANAQNCYQNTALLRGERVYWGFCYE